MASLDSLDSQKIYIKTEPVDSFEWESRHYVQNGNPQNDSDDQRGDTSTLTDTGMVCGESEEGVSHDRAHEIAGRVRRIKRCDSGNDDTATDDSMQTYATLKSIKRRVSSEDPSSQSDNSHLPNLDHNSTSQKSKDCKPTREELEAFSKSVSKSNSSHSISGGENSLGKTLATSLKLIATNSISSPLTHSPAASDGNSYRIETASCTSSSQVSGGTTPVMILSPVISLKRSPTIPGRRYRTRSMSKPDKVKTEQNNRKDATKLKTKDSEMMKPLLNKDGSVTLYQCEECNKVFNKKQTLRQHFITHTDRFACPYCDSRCKSKGDLRTHIQTHTKEKPFHCDVCNTDYTRESILKKHMRTQLHMRAVYERDSLARLHKTTSNTEKDKDIDQFVATQTKVRLEGFTCHQCPKVLFSKAQYRRHVNSHVLKHTCNVCQKGCKSALLLKIHKRSHSKSTFLTCKICSRSFANLYSLKEHLKSHKAGQAKKMPEESLIKAAISKHNKDIMRLKMQTQSAANSKSARGSHCTPLKSQKWQCETCSKAFTSEKRLENHNRIHEGTYICGVCKKAFSTLSKLKIHLKFHAKLLKCDICDLEFHDEQELNDHVHNQHDDADFICKICYDQFDNATDLQHHMNDHAPTMLFSGGSLDESTIPVLNRTHRKPASSGIDSSKFSDFEDSSDDDVSIKRSDKPEASKSCDSDDDSILGSQEFHEIINSALDGSDDNLNDAEISDSDDELYAGIKAVLENEVLSSGDSDEESREQSILHKPILYGQLDIMKKHGAEFEKYAEKDIAKGLFKCKLCSMEFEEDKYLRNHLKCHVCEYCNKFFTDKEKLAAHKARHVRQLLKQIKTEACRLRIPHTKWKGYLMASSDSEIEIEDQFLNELEDILEGEPPKAPRSGNFLHTLSHDEIVRANKHIFEQYSCLDLTNNIFACTICKRKYARPTTLTRHFKTHVCQFCNKFFEDKSDLLEHKYRHRKKAALMKAEITGEGSKMPASPVVSKPNRDMFKRYSYIDSHRNINRCTLCCKDFVRRTVLTRHMKTHICSHCDKFFEDKYDLAKHVTLHKVEKQYFDDEDADNDDFADFDDDEKQYSTNSSITGNLDHEEKSLPLPPAFSSSLGHFNPSFHTQPSCSSRNETITFIQIPSTESGDTAGTQVFSTPGSGTSSFQIISQPVEVYKDSTQESFLVASASCPGSESEKIITISQPQIVPSSSEERERLFECGECGKRFFKNGHLKSHMTIHTGDRPYVCRLCGKAFGRGTTLRKHEKTHMKRCKICDTTFSHKYELDLHMEIHRTYAFYK